MRFVAAPDRARRWREPSAGLGFTHNYASADANTGLG